MTLLLFKLCTTPALIALATWVSRRWGQSVAGWLVGLPLTSGPIAVFLALEHGRAFSAQAALGSLQGTTAQACFVAAYCHAARRLPWPYALAAGAAAFAVSGSVLEALHLGAGVLAVIAASALSTVLILTPADAPTAPVASPPRFDLPARMLVAAALVVAITGLAHWVGPQTSGLIATFPLFAAVLGVFAHRLSGLAAAQYALRGLLFGLYAFTGFFLTLHMLVEPRGIVQAMLAATVVAIAIQAASYALMARLHPGRAASADAAPVSAEGRDT